MKCVYMCTFRSQNTFLNKIRNFLKQFRSKKMSFDYRNKPIILVFGCTGTGKTKLSIQLAKVFQNQAEIINADALQVNLDREKLRNEVFKI